MVRIFQPRLDISSDIVTQQTRKNRSRAFYHHKKGCSIDFIHSYSTLHAHLFIFDEIFNVGFFFRFGPEKMFTPSRVSKLAQLARTNQKRI